MEGETEQAAPEAPQVEDQGALEASVVAAQEAFDAAQDAASEAAAALIEAQKAMDEAIAAAEGPKHPHQDQIDRMAYIKSQAEQRAARHGIATQLREGSPDPEVLDPRSPIDKSMQRNTKRGAVRPKVLAK